MKGKILAAAVLGLAACAPHRPLERVMANGELLPAHSDEVVERARAEGSAERARLEERRGEAAAAALGGCAPEVCAAIARGELALGMTEAQVLAATRTTGEAWDTRRSGPAATMTARGGDGTRADAVGRIAFVGFRDGRVASYTYREPQGFRTVTTRADATLAGQAAARADALLREGDGYAAAGELGRALERYDQADILRPGHAETTLRIARTLDKQLRPIEAVLRYRLFIHQLELERIHAHGQAAARIAEAITRAQERIVVIEKR